MSKVLGLWVLAHWRESVLLLPAGHHLVAGFLTHKVEEGTGLLRFFNTKIQRKQKKTK